MPCLRNVYDQIAHVLDGIRVYQSHSYPTSHFHAKEHLFMKRLIPLVLVALAVTASAAFAADGGVQGKSPAQFCKNELVTLGAANFRSLYAPGGSGANAMGKCVSKHARAAAANRTNAAKACKAEQAIPEADFRAAHDGKSFAEVYGRNDNDRNAYGKCVSSKASSANAQQEAATIKAAKACKAERTADRTAFTAKYGGKAASAFGKCVSSKSKTQ
jgi:hypothetical protein